MNQNSRSPMVIATMAVLIPFLSGCATQQQTGAVGGVAVGVLACKLVAKEKCSARELALLTSLSMMAGSLIGKQLDESDWRRAEQAAQDALAAQDAAVQQTLATGNDAIEQQLRADLAAARTEADRARARERAAKARRAAAQANATRTPAPVVTWNGDGANGSAQAIGPAQVPGRSDCEKVREIAYIAGKEVRQEATFCRGDHGGKVRVA